MPYVFVRYKPGSITHSDLTAIQAGIRPIVAKHLSVEGHLLTELDVEVFFQEVGPWDLTKRELALQIVATKTPKRTKINLDVHADQITMEVQVLRPDGLLFNDTATWIWLVDGGFFGTKYAPKVLGGALGVHLG